MSDEMVQDRIRNDRERGRRQSLFVVVATPVEEIGRDHDFDWAVIEPSSTPSIVQTTGRVNRHRLREREEKETWSKTEHGTSIRQEVVSLTTGDIGWVKRDVTSVEPPSNTWLSWSFGALLAIAARVGISAEDAFAVEVRAGRSPDGNQASDDDRGWAAADKTTLHCSEAFGYWRRPTSKTSAADVAGALYRT